MPELLNCPFCGGEARKWQDPSHSAAWFIGCDDGDRDCFGSFHWAETEAAAIAAWNRRAIPARGVGVKPLQWNDAAFLEQYAKSVVGTYRVFEKDGLWRATVHTVDDAHFVAETEYLHDAKAAAQADYEARILAALAPTDAPNLADPVTVHANMLRGTIAKPTVEQIIHLYGREAFRPVIDAAVAKALEDACLAVSEHADWPEDEHGRTEQVGLFARVINAICSIAPATTEAPHVNETPKSEHDAGNVLTDAAQAREAALHPDDMLPEAIRLIRQEASRDHSREVVTGLKHIALLLEQLIGEARDD